MRCFAGIDLSPALKKQIAELRTALQAYTVSGHWKHIENYHLTLKFLGEVGSGQLEKADRRLEAAATATSPFSLSISHLGFFPGRHNIRVLWLGLNGDLDRLGLLQGKVEAGMEDAGFPREQRPYKPHITLGQELVMTKRPEELVSLAMGERWETIPVDRIILFRSEQIRGKRVYSPVREYSLKG